MFCRKREIPYFVCFVFNRAPASQGGSAGLLQTEFQLIWEVLLSPFPPAFDLLSGRVLCVKIHLKVPFTLKFLAFMFCFLSGFWKYKREFLYADMLSLTFYNSIINCLSFMRDILYLTTSLSFIFILSFKMASPCPPPCLASAFNQNP